MSAFFSFSLFSLFVFFLSLPLATSRHHIYDSKTAKNINIINEACKASRDPPTCEAWLSQSGHVARKATVLQVIQSALQVTIQNLEKGRDMVQDFSNASAGNVTPTDVADNCLEGVNQSDYRVKRILAGGDALTTRGGLKEARAWMSAVLSNENGCWSGLKKVNDTPQVAQTMQFFNDTLVAGSSSVLGMLVNYDIYGEKTGSWGPARTERDGFWEPVSSSGPAGWVAGGIPSGLKANVTVCKGGGGGGCNYETVQAAVDAAPVFSEKLFVIWIKAGVYDEIVRVPFEKTNVVFLGDGMGKTVITGSRNVGQPRMTTYNTSNVGVSGDGFMARDITFQNTAGPVTSQAVAFRSSSDRSIVENCEFLGNQDTLYAHSLRQYYKSCRIQGNVDFIFGNAAAVFHDCQILIAPRQQNPEKGEKNAVTAQAKFDPAQSTGYVFENCVINGTEAYLALFRSNPKVHQNFLGRPWRDYARTVFIRCFFEALISPDGWMPWDDEPSRLKTLYYGEFNNAGAGANVSRRVGWSSQIPAEHVDSYSVQNFIQGNEWIK